MCKITATCGPGEFTCHFDTSLLCLHAERKCDGRAVCPDQADEKNCGMVKTVLKAIFFFFQISIYCQQRLSNKHIMSARTLHRYVTSTYRWHIVSLKQQGNQIPITLFRIAFWFVLFSSCTFKIQCFKE